MSCNGFGHPPDCLCGWGGVFYGNHVKTLWDGNSFTIPNAQCPKCGSSVFFYKNSHGSAVYFDELGPPWPKHPCTSEALEKPASDLKKKTPELDGSWHPLRVYWLQRAPGLSLLGISPSRHLLFEAGKSINKLDAKAPWFYRMVSLPDQKLRFSTIAPNKNGEMVELQFHGYGIGALRTPGMKEKYPEIYSAHYRTINPRR